MDSDSSPSGITPQEEIPSADLMHEALERCAAEQIHLVSAIQAHGFLLGVDEDGLVRMASDNVESLFGCPTNQVLGRPVEAILGSEALAELNESLSHGGFDHTISVEMQACCGEVVIGLSAIAHRADGLTIIELKPAMLGKESSIKRRFSAVHESLWTFDQDTDVDAYCQYVAEEMLKITAFDRVKIYRFDSLWNGEVIAESRNQVLPTLLHHHFPASDIPPQARALYMQNLVRILSDTEAATIPITPNLNPLTGKPLDLSLSIFRAISPIHIEYMRNMGVRSSITVSLIHKGRLWGLIACHCASAKHVDNHLRELIEFIGKSVSMKLGALESAARENSMEKVRQRLQNLTEILRGSSDIDLVIRLFQDDYLSLAAASGSYICFDNGNYVIGDVPMQSDLMPLVAWLKTQEFNHGVFVTDNLRSCYPAAHHFDEVASGLLALDLDNQRNSLILWFRPEVVRNIPWAGKPQREVVMDAHGPRIDPRRSFNVWYETARGFSEPWGNSSVDAVKLFSFSVVQMLMHRAQQQVHASDAASKAKSGFLANMSHEIRTPMNAIIGLTYLCQQTPLNQQQRDYLDKINASASNLLRILNDILDFSKIEAGRLSIEETAFDLSRVIDSVATVTSIQSQQKDIEFVVDMAADCPKQVVGDPLRLEQVLVNLTSNAIKFTDDGEIVMSVRMQCESDDTVTLHFLVADTGIGIDAEALSRLFQPFQQADNSITRHYGGTGLGLSICHHLVEMMGGTIDVSSTPGRGSQFEFTACFGKCVHGTRQVQLSLPDLRGLNTLIVDDNERARSVMRHYLEAFTFQVTDAPNGAKALAVFEGALHSEAPFDLVIIDWEMPDIDGLETARRIAALCRGQKTPRLMLVSMHSHVWNQPESRFVNAILTKPFTPSRLFNTIAAMFVRHGATELPIPGETSDRHRIAGAQLLLVEDNEINQLVAQQILEGAGAIVTIAGDGASAVALVAARRYDGILMDIHMPIMDGYAAALEIRRQFPANALPIIAMTANAMAGDRERCLAAGMNDHITKPVDPEAMFRTLARWIVPALPLAPPILIVGCGSGEGIIPNLPGVSVAEAVQRLNGDIDGYLHLLDRFRQTYRGSIVAIRLALIEGDHQLADRLAHTLKGVAGNLGAMNLHGRMHDLDAAIRNCASQEVMAGLLNSADSDLAVLLRAIDQALPPTHQPVPQEAEPEEPNVLRQLVQTTLLQLAECDSEADASVARIRRQLGRSLVAMPIFERIEACLARYDYEAAQSELLSLVDHLDSLVKGIHQ